MGSIFFLLLAVVACSNTATPSPTVVTSSAVPPTPSAIPTPSPTASPLPTATPSPLPTATPSPRPMAPATLRPGPKMTTAREGQTAVRLADGRVLILGGIVSFPGKCEMACIEPATASVEIYDPRTGKFSHDGSLAQARVGANAVLLSDATVLVMGGGYGAPVETMEIYDPAMGTSALVKLPANVASLPAEAATSLLADGRVLIAGGTYNNSSTSNATLVFNPANGTFDNGPLMAKPRQEATATLLVDGRVLIVGGEDSGSWNDDAEVIDPSRPLAKSTLLQTVYPLEPVAPETPITLSDGRVLVAASGSSAVAGCSAPSDFEVFDPRTDELSYPARMITPHSGASAIRVGDGRVLFFGGLDSHCAPAVTVEAFDPDSGTLQVVATGFPKITGFSATLLDDGEILIAGGSDANVYWNGQTAKSWLLKP